MAETMREGAVYTDLFSGRLWDAYEQNLLSDAEGFQQDLFVNKLKVADIYKDSPYNMETYLRGRFAESIELGEYTATPEQKEKATAYLDDYLLGEDPDDPDAETFRRGNLSAQRAYLKNYFKEANSLDNTDPLTRKVEEEDKNFTYPITTLGVMSGAGGPQEKVKTEAETEYGAFTEAVSIDETERQFYFDNKVNPNRFFESGKDFQYKWINDHPSLITKYSGVGAMATAAKQIDVTSESPWRLKAMFLPANPTPEEMEFIMFSEFPEVEGKISYINPRQPDAGLAIRVPKRGGTEGETERIPLRPQWGLSMITEEGLTMLGQESGTILAEAALTQGKGSLAKLIKKGSDELANGLAQASKKGAARGLGKAMGQAATTSISAAFGRYAQLLSARERGINNLSEERMFDDAKLAALWAGGSSLVISTALGTLSKIRRLITGEDVPIVVFEKIIDRLEKLKAVEKNPAVEFTNKELVAIAENAGNALSNSRYKMKPTVGQLTEDPELKALESELYAELAGTSSKAARAFEEVILGNRESAYAFWKALTKNNEDFAGIDIKDFQDFLRLRNEEFLEEYKSAGLREQEKIQGGVKLDIAPQSPLKQTTEELGTPFIRDTETGGLVFSRNSKEFALNADSAFKRYKAEYETELNKFSNLTYPKGGLNNQAISFIIEPFRKVLNAGGEDSIIKTLADAELGQVIRDLIPMRDGVSVLKQLAGDMRNKEGRVLPKLDLTYGDLVSMRNAVESVLLTHPDSGVKAAVKPLLDGIDKQADDLLSRRAVKELKEAGINPIPSKVDAYLKEVDWMQPLITAKNNFEQFKTQFDRKYLQDFASQSADNLTPFLLKSSPDQLDQLLKQIYVQPDSIVKLGNIRQLVLNDMNSVLAKYGDDPIEQNKQWKKYVDANEAQLKALFPENSFLKIKNFEVAQRKASESIDEINKGIVAFQDELEIEDGLSNFIENIIMVGKGNRLSGKQKQAIENFAKVKERHPELDTVIFELVKSHLGDAFESYRTAAPTSRGPAGQAFLADGIDFGGLAKFIDEGFKPGKQGQQDLAYMFKQLFGHEEGAEYAKNLRAFVFIADKQKEAPLDTILDTVSKSTKSSLDEHIALISALQRIFISPLTKTSRQITFAKEKLRMNAAEDLLSVMMDPWKMKKLINARNRMMTVKEMSNFLGSLAISREQVDIGTSRGMSVADRKIKQLEEDDSGEIDSMSRIWDLLEIE